MKNFLLKNTVLLSRMRAINEKVEKYKNFEKNKQKILEYQLQKFNKVWKKAQSQKFYEYWKELHNLPQEIKCLEELHNFPCLNKTVLKEHSNLIFFESSRRYMTVSTGGSSGEPTKFITSRTEKKFEYADTYLGRCKFGIEPLDKTLLIWGHSHLFGSGWRGKLNDNVRTIKDIALNITRVDAYDVSSANLEKIGRQILTGKFQVLIGYSSAVYGLAAFIDANKIPKKREIFRKLKAIIVTAESILPQEISFIEKVFETPVALEYGMAETGVVAYNSPYRIAYDVFWDSFIVRSDKAPENKEVPIFITTLSHKNFPLINYQPGDNIILLKGSNTTSILSFGEVAGRTRDNVNLKTLNGEKKTLSGIYFVHLLKNYKGILILQFYVRKNGSLRIGIVAEKDFNLEKYKKYILADFKKENPDIDMDQITFALIEKTEKTLAGKSPLFIWEK